MSEHNKPKTDENTIGAGDSALRWFTKSDFEKMDKEELELLMEISSFLRAFMNLTRRQRKVFNNAFYKALARATRKAGRLMLKRRIKDND